MIICRYCNNRISNITSHLNSNNLCKKEHKLWKREIYISKKEKYLVSREEILNNFLNQSIFIPDSNFIINEFSIVFEEDSEIKILNKFSTDKIYEATDDICCPICLQENLERKNFVITNNCGHFMCKSCLDILENKPIEEHKCPVCRTKI